MTYEKITMYLKVSKVAAIYDVSSRTVTRWCSMGRFEGAFKTDGIRGSWRIPVEAVDAFSKQEKKK